MRPGRHTWQALARLIELRQASADVVDLIDRVVYGPSSEASVATRMLPVRLQRLSRRLQRAQTALQEEEAG